MKSVFGEEVLNKVFDGSAHFRCRSKEELLRKFEPASSEKLDVVEIETIKLLGRKEDDLLCITKTIPIFHPSSISDSTLRELRVSREISTLQEHNPGLCFAKMVDWFVSQNENPFSGRDDSDNRSSHGWFLHMISIFEEGVVLSKIEELTIDEYRSCLYQILYSIGVAQKELEFMHRDIHPGNILISRTENGIITKLVDYGKSRTRKQRMEEVPGYSKFYSGMDIFSTIVALRSVNIRGDNAESRCLLEVNLFDNRMDAHEFLKHEFFDPVRK